MTKTLEETEDAMFACAAAVLLVLGVAAMPTNAAFAPGVVAASSRFVESDAVDLKLVEAAVVVAAADEVEMAYPVVVDAAAESAADLAAALGGRLAVASEFPSLASSSSFCLRFNFSSFARCFSNSFLFFAARLYSIRFRCS